MVDSVARRWLAWPRPDVRRLEIRLGWSFRIKTVYWRPSASLHTHGTGDRRASQHTDYNRSSRRSPASYHKLNIQDHPVERKGEKHSFFFRLLGVWFCFSLGFEQWISCHVKVLWIIRRCACPLVWQLCQKSILLEASVITSWHTTLFCLVDASPGQQNRLRSSRPSRSAASFAETLVESFHGSLKGLFFFPPFWLFPIPSWFYPFWTLSPFTHAGRNLW